MTPFLAIKTKNKYLHKIGSSVEYETRFAKGLVDMYNFNVSANQLATI